MSIPRAFIFEEGRFTPYAFPLTQYDHSDPPAEFDALYDQAFDALGFDAWETNKLSYGGPAKNLNVTVRTVLDPTAEEQQFAFALTVDIASTSHYVFCRALPDLLAFLRYIEPILHIDIEGKRDNLETEQRFQKYMASGKRTDIED